MNLKAVSTIVSFLFVVHAQAALPVGDYSVPHELFNSEQLPAMTLSIDDEAQFQLYVDPNSCEFSDEGVPTFCTEMAPMMKTGTLSQVRQQGDTTLYAFGEQVQFFLVYTESLQELRVVAFNTEGKVVSSRELHAEGQ